VGNHGQGPIRTRTAAVLGAAVLVLSGGDLAAGEPSGRAAVVAAFADHVRPLLQTYCLDCHGLGKVKGDTNLRWLTDGEAALRDLPLVRHALNKLRSHEMPPPGEQQPSEVERAQAGAWLAAVRRLAPPDPGTAPARRLAKREYANTLRDLFGVDPAIADELPDDRTGAGFSSSIAPLVMEKYLLIADEVLDRVIRPGQARLAWRAGQLDARCGGKNDPGKADGVERLVTGPLQLDAVLPAPVDGT
jgi:mono/diheme cytochrome c family protein